jgi:hypothetical protein
VAVPEFFFSIDLSDQTASRDLFAEVAGRVSALAGPAADGALRGVHLALELCAAQGQQQCRVTFRARDGLLEVAVSTSAGQVWQGTESLA